MLAALCVGPRRFAVPSAGFDRAAFYGVRVVSHGGLRPPLRGLNDVRPSAGIVKGLSCQENHRIKERNYIVHFFLVLIRNCFIIERN
jgi:hypothetical protein